MARTHDVAATHPNTHELCTPLARVNPMARIEGNRPTACWTFPCGHVSHLKVVEANRRQMGDRKQPISPGVLQYQRLLSPMSLCRSTLTMADRTLCFENFG